MLERESGDGGLTEESTDEYCSAPAWLGMQGALAIGCLEKRDGVVLKLWIVNARVVCCLLLCSMLCDMRDPASTMTVSTSERGNRLGGGGVIEHKLL